MIKSSLLAFCTTEVWIKNGLKGENVNKPVIGGQLASENRKWRINILIVFWHFHATFKLSLQVSLIEFLVLDLNSCFPFPDANICKHLEAQARASLGSTRVSLRSAKWAEASFYPPANRRNGKRTFALSSPWFSWCWGFKTATFG